MPLLPLLTTSTAPSRRSNVCGTNATRQDGDDALSLLASVDSLSLDLGSAWAKAEAEGKAAEEMFKRIAELESKIVTLESRIRSMGGSV